MPNIVVGDYILDKEQQEVAIEQKAFALFCSFVPLRRVLLTDPVKALHNE